MEDYKSYFAKAPKADVHNHLHLSGSQKRFFELYPEAKIKFPKNYDGLPGMIDFIYSSLNSIMTTGEDVINFMNISVQSSIDDGVTYLEASVDTNLSRFFDGDYNAVINEVKRLKTEHKDQILFRPDIGINKELPLDKVYEYGETFIDSGEFSGIDLYGNEAGKELSPFVDLFNTAKSKDIKTKVHIGEFSDAESIAQTIELLEPEVIQHGINAVHSEKVMDMILERNIRLNICPESNLRLGAVNNLKTHPIRILFDKGIKVCVNTDDLILFDATVSRQLIDLVEQGVFSFDEAEVIRKNGF